MVGRKGEGGRVAYPGARRGSVVVAKVVSYEATTIKSRDMGV